ncbi:gephyrin-like molybdotransferase Glp [Sphingomonas sp. MMS24-J13]|uniref:molybdopterin molybdotransferase MoeA n=1 Tax=Sphingomonas sp. MMS24-J13 TaxID=3238686 RepID=UPI00384E9BB1
MSLLPVAEAQARLLALARDLPIERAPFVEAIGRHAAEDIVAGRAQPAADLSAMDGYAIRFAELPGPWRVVGESRAGAGLDYALAPGEAARIFTGAPLPAGADTVLVQEEATRDGEVLRLSGEGPALKGYHVRAHGSDFAQGDILVAAGERLTPARIALAAMGGHGTVPVPRRPRITIISTGDELIRPGQPGSGLALPASNGPMLAAMLAGLPAEVRDGGILPDRLDELTEGFAAAARDADIIVTTGGASVGDHDLVRPALKAAGADMDFWRVRMRPGKPLMAGRLQDAIVLGLPGNPVSAFVTAFLFLLPLVRRLVGDTAPFPKGERMPLAGPLPKVTERTDFLRGLITPEGILPLSGQDSAALAMLARADALIVRAGEAPAAPVGEIVDILRIA